MKTAPADWSQSEVSNQGAEFVAQRHESFIEKKIMADLNFQLEQDWDEYSVIKLLHSFYALDL